MSMTATDYILDIRGLDKEAQRVLVSVIADDNIAMDIQATSNIFYDHGQADFLDSWLFEGYAKEGTVGKFSIIWNSDDNTYYITHADLAESFLGADDEISANFTVRVVRMHERTIADGEE